MKKLILCLVLALASPVPAPAAEETATPPAKSAKSSRARVITAAPAVNTNMATAGSMPKGHILAVLNSSFEHRYGSNSTASGSDVFSQTWLLKFRYGVLDWLETFLSLPYPHMTRYNDPTPSPQYLDGPADAVAGLYIAPYNLHQGDPFALSFQAALVVPIAPEGKTHLPGNRVWGGRLTGAFGTFLTPDLRFDTEFVFTGPFGRGNQEVRRGVMYQWNTQFRYMFDLFDIALESTLVRQESGDRDIVLQNGTRTNMDLRNGSTDWWVGPTMNFALGKETGAWFGIGVLFPVYHHYDGPNYAESGPRLELKLGWFW